LKGVSSNLIPAEIRGLVAPDGGGVLSIGFSTTINLILIEVFSYLSKGVFNVIFPIYSPAGRSVWSQSNHSTNCLGIGDVAAP
jgi:hypothetical protein